MNYCPNCGEKVDNNAYVCVRCGFKLRSDNVENSNDNGSIAWGILGFLVPIAGIIIYFIMKKDNPKNSKMAIRGSLINLCLNFVLFVISIIMIIFSFPVIDVPTHNSNYNNWNEDYIFE